jgi:predicted ATPase
MFSTMNYLAFHQEHFYARAAATRISPLADVSDYSPLIYLEEPESNVFPETQRELIQLFAWLSSDPVLSFDWVLTTHSPYVLSVFGDLVKAGTIGAQSAGHHVATAKVIAEKY